MLCFASDIATIDASNRSLSEFMYDLTPRLTRGVETTVSLSATNAIGNSNYSNILTITIPLQGNALLSSVDGLKYICANN